MSTTVEQHAKAELNGKRIVITGATTGIGRATAILLAQLGANVVITGQSEDHLSETLTDMESAGVKERITGLISDLSTKEGIEEVFAKADEVLGGLDIMINNAALAYQSVTEGDYEGWERVVKTNLLGYLACTRMALDRMASSGKGHIVYIGSMSAGVREEGSSVYVATKAGIQGFAESLRKEVNKKGIKITLIEPGAVGSDMQPTTSEEEVDKQNNLEMLKAEDIAEAVVYALQQPERCDVVELKIKPLLQII